MTVRGGIISYGPYASDESSILVRKLSFGDAVTGADDLWSINPTFYADIRTGEISLREGAKVTVQEVWLRTYTGGGTVYPDAICMVRGTEESSWRSAGDGNGTISVTTTACTGTGTAWSNLIKAGDDSADAITLPWPAAGCRIFTSTDGSIFTAWTLTTNYTISDTKEITPVSAIATGTSLYAYYEGVPDVVVAAGDYIETSEGFHRILTIPTATSMTLSWYPSTTLTGTHHSAQQFPSGEGEVQFGIGYLVDSLQIRFVLVPRSSANAVSEAKAIGYTVCWDDSGDRNFE